MEKPKINADRIVSISAIIVSAATLIMILYQTSLTREHQKSSVIPSLKFGYGINVDPDTDEIIESIRVKNLGLGPAFIERIKVIDNDKVYETDPYGYILETQPKDSISKVTFNRVIKGSIIPANDGVLLYSKTTNSTSVIFISNLFEFGVDIHNMPSFKKNKAVIEITYKNVYDDKWIIRSDKAIPVEVD